ncbi:hypothetical protein BT93_B0966 [Corymbia citriodora subsp. variegata]|nr:hypothetical protein BT93_B0966 [Corymbia citriodora subsp. variegata]
MAPPANLAHIGREGFDLLEKTWGHRRRPNLATPPPPPEQKAQPCVYTRTEVPLITQRVPEYVVSLPAHQYQQPGYPSSRRSEVPLHHYYHSNYHHYQNPYPPSEDDAHDEAMDSNEATILFRGMKIVEYRRV